MNSIQKTTDKLNDEFYNIQSQYLEHKGQKEKRAWWRQSQEKGVALQEFYLYIKISLHN